MEALMGEPQDVEWAYQNDTLYLLQTRPVTAAGQEGTASLYEAPDFDTEWTRANHPDTLPELPSPLFLSLMERTQDRGLQFFHRMGLEVGGMGPYIKSFYGRPYLNLSIIRRILAQLGFNPTPLLAMAGYLQAETIANPFRIEWGRARRALRPYANLLAETFTLGQTLESYRQTVRQTIHRLEQMAPTPAEALAQFKLRERVYGELIGVGLVLVSLLTGLTVLTARLLTPVVGSAAETFQRLGTLGKNPLAVHHQRTLLRLSRLARTDPVVHAYLAGAHSYAAYRVALQGTPFLSELDAYLREYGYRATYEPDMSWPRLSEQPETLLQTIARYASLKPDALPPATDETAGQSFWQMWRDLIARARGVHRWLPWRQLLALPLMGLLHKGFALRNDLFTAQAKAMAAIRAWDLSLARRWVAAGYLESPDDYFWLTMEEIERALVAEAESGFNLKPSIAARKTAYQTYRQTRVPFVLKNSQIPTLLADESPSADLLADTLIGLPVSPGQAQGVVRFLQEVEGMEELPEGTILVVPSTDPVYLPYFPMAAGLIVDRGGMLSHGSIIAREYGLPAVSNMADLRQHLHPGDRVLLDGSTGVVQILEKARST
ncbi:MAG: hypothetical protein D6796_01920 [Caldilineae bacterium]|nr:MAG: hypothetical protein D6796_01920 [Caldilineae bacterium]